LFIENALPGKWSRPCSATCPKESESFRSGRSCGALCTVRQCTPDALFDLDTILVERLAVPTFAELTVAEPSAEAARRRSMPPL
jgi:hypothetical protein